MKKHDVPPLSQRPFAALGERLREKAAVGPVDKAPPAGEAAGDDLFLKAMEGVRPLKERGEKEIPRPAPRLGFPLSPAETEVQEVMERLKRLVTTGEGFIPSLTPEYVEGTVYNLPLEYARRLHAGDFSIQAHIDLHGLTVPEAREIFDAFMGEAVRKGLSGVLIIHGRGLSSPGEPVLKGKIVQWLTGGTWRRRVCAYASARSCDGGTGATYVLLNPRPPGRRTRNRSV